MIFLCRIEDLGATAAKGVVLGEGADALDVVVVEKNKVRYAYVNSCPHQFIPLEIFPGYFFTEDGKHLICSGHGALFEPDTGKCVLGPCLGDSLQPLAITEKDSAVYLTEQRSPEDIARARRSARNW